MKRCSICKLEKEILFFYKNKSSKDGHRSNCIDCSKEYKEKNKEKEIEYRLNNKDKRRDYDKNRIYDPVLKKDYYERNKESILLDRKVHYENNRQKKIEYQIDYQRNNKSKRNQYLVNRRESDPIFKLITNIRNLIYNSFYYNGYSKKSKTECIIDCSFSELKNYLESKFEDWMTWDNKGLYNGEFNYGWDIDHIIPLSSASVEDDLIRLNHYTNLQPLCSKVNRDIKRNKTEYGI
jgi:hypothetical protein